MINALKSFATVLNFILLLALLSYIFYKLKKYRTSKIIAYLDIVLLLLLSTGPLPRFLAHQLEKNFSYFNPNNVQNLKGTFYVHVLGSGYSPDEGFPANIQLGTTAIARLSEGVRIVKMYDSAVLVCSGKEVDHKLPNDTSTQAKTAKNAAVMLGVDPSKIVELNTPATTQEEALDLVEKFGKDIVVVIVTDAIHLPRAIRCFKKVGVTEIFAAPAITQTIGTNKSRDSRWWPSIGNLSLSDQVIHEYLGNIKAILLNFKK